MGRGLRRTAAITGGDRVPEAGLASMSGAAASAAPKGNHAHIIADQSLDQVAGSAGPDSVVLR